MSPKNTKIDEVLEAMHLLSEQMHSQFIAVENRLDRVGSRLERNDGQIASLVNKVYLDDKLADLRGDLTLLTRNEDGKLLALVDLLYGKRLMTKEESKYIMVLQPFVVA